MEQDDIQKVRNVDVVYIQQKLDEGYIYTQDTEGKNLILVIGNTGVGKSTTCNYLCGYPMKEVKMGYRFVIDTVEETNIKIGHEVMSETLYAKSLSVNDTSSNNQPLCLLDCPGFFGNRTIEEKVIESISTELAIRNALQIKGFLILISLNTLCESRVGELRELIKTLISLFKDPIEMVQYSIFIITKKNKYMPVKEAEEITIGAMESLKKFCEEQATLLFKNQNLTSSENLTFSDYNKIATYLSSILEKPGNVIFIDPLDSGESKKLILNKINCVETRKSNLKKDIKIEIGPDQTAANATTDEICPITIDDFCFSEYDEHRILFNKALYHLADDGIELINAICQGVEDIQNYLSEICEAKKNIIKLYDEQYSIQEDLYKTSKEKSQNLRQTVESTKRWKLMIVQNNDWIKSKEERIQNIDEVESVIHEGLKNIDNDNPLKFRENRIYKKISWWKIFGWEEMEFSADTGNCNIPIIAVDKDMQNGWWYDEVDRRGNGYYSVKYRSEYGARPAAASVETYIKTKDEVGNRICIERYKQKCVDLMKEREDLKLEIIDLKSSNKTLESNIEEVEMNTNGYEDMLKTELQNSKRNMDYYNSERNKKLKAIIETKAAGLKNLERFNQNQRKYSILIKINTLINFPSSLITSFINKYNIFLPDIDKYRSHFDKKGTVSSFYSKEKSVFNLENTRDGREITDVVVTGADAAYNDDSVPKQFDASTSEDIPPFISKQEGELLDDNNCQSKFVGKNTANLDSFNAEEEKTFKIEDPLTKKEIENIVVTRAGTLFDKHSLLKQFNTSNPESFPTVTEAEVHQVTNENFKEENEKLVQEIKEIKEQLKKKEMELQKTYRKLEENDLRPSN